MNRFEELTRSHNRVGFDCGVQELNVFLHNLAHQNFKKGLSRTFVLTSEDIPNEDAKKYYLKFGFIPLPDHTLELFLPLKTLQKMYVEVFEKK